MIKLKKYNDKQISVIRDTTCLDGFITQLSEKVVEEIPISKKRIEMFKIAILYMSIRKNELLMVDISKKDADYIVKQELKHLNLVLKELKDAIPKNC